MFKGWVHTGWIMRTNVQEDARTFRHFLDISNHIVKVQIRVGSIVIAVLLHFQAGVGKDGNVIAPSWVWNVNLRMALLLENFAKNAKTPSARKGLDSRDATLFERLTIFAVHKGKG